MLVVELNGSDYHIATTWDDLTLRKAIALAKLAKKMPEKLAEAYKQLVDPEVAKEATDAVREIEKTLTHKERTKVMPKFYGEVLAICSDIKKKDLDTMPHEWRTGIYQQYLEPFVFGCRHYPHNYQCQNLPHFFFDMGRVFDEDGKEVKKSYKRQLVKFFLPENTKGLTGSTPMGNEQAVVWTESADLEHFSKEMEAGNLTHAANICTVIARPMDLNGKIEEYDEKKILARAAHFLDLPMSVVWEVFFCFIVRSIMLQKRAPISFKVATSKAARLPQPAASIGTDGTVNWLKRLARSVTLKKLSA